MLRLSFKSYRILSIVAFAASAIGCGQGVSFNPGSNVSSAASAASVPGGSGTGGSTGSGSVTPPPGSGSGCGTGGISTTRLTKVLLLVDTSGSNVEWTEGSSLNLECTAVANVGCFPPTDPNKTFRLGSIQQFFTKYSVQSNFQWSFTTFSGTSAQPLVTNSSSNPIFSASNTVVQTAINTFASMTDDGGTPFHAALTSAYATVASDPDLNGPLNPQYFVVLLTDGYPTDYTTATDASGDVSALVGLSPSEVNLSTIFYGPQNVAPSTTAIQLLTAMAQMGNGQFVNVNNPGSGIDISTVIAPANCP